ncbi:hypothetical protein, partial [Bradyrhizobium sp. LeoA1S1]
MSPLGPSQHIALPPELGRYRGKADIAFVASRRRVYGYTGLALLWQIVFSPLFFTDLLSAIWALLRRRPKDEIDDGV